MISIEKYKMISPVLKRITHNVWACENETRKKKGEQNKPKDNTVEILIKDDKHMRFAFYYDTDKETYF